MTSKEALDYIEKVMVAENGRLSLYEKLNIKTIAKDLEVLEILKKYLYQGVDVYIQNDWRRAIMMEAIPSYDCNYKNNEEYELIKEWLDNDARETNTK